MSGPALKTYRFATADQWAACLSDVTDDNWRDNMERHRLWQAALAALLGGWLGAGPAWAGEFPRVPPGAETLPPGVPPV